MELSYIYNDGQINSMSQEAITIFGNSSRQSIDNRKRQVNQELISMKNTQ